MRWSFAAVVALVCSVAGADPARPTVKPTVKPAPKPTISKLKIGAYLSMTGASAPFGVSTHQGILLAIEEHNTTTTGRKIDLETLDTASKPAEAGPVVTRLIDNGAIAILGEVASSMTLAGGAVAQSRRVPMVTPAATNPSVTQVGDMISRVCFLDDAQAYALAKFTRDDLKLTKIAILYDQAQVYSTNLATVFASELGKLGGTITTKQSYAGEPADYKPQLRAIAASRPQAIFVPGYWSNVAEIAKQARDLKLTVPLIGGDGWDSEELLKLAGSALDGYYANHFSPADPRPTTQAFVSAFRAKYKHDPDGLAALGYDAARILVAAIASAKSHNGTDVNAAIRATTNHDGVTGTITIDPKTGEAKKPVVIIKVTNGTASLAATMPPR